MKKIFLYEPSIASDNTGDQVIVQGVKDALKDFLKDNFTVEMPTHTPVTNRYALHMRKPDMKIICGSNILTGHLDQLRHTKQWALNYITAWQLNNSIFVGVGAQQYQKCNAYTKRVYKKMFHPDYIHSVRDGYTEKFLKNIGITNVVNTGCPTMWRLTPEHCSKIPTRKSESVILTLTDYSPDRERDEYLIETLLSSYKTVYFWVQGNKDFAYFNSLSHADEIKQISPQLDRYDEFLENEDVDFVGTRLHGGMRALQKGHRTLIIGIDNRAIEMHKDFNIPVLYQDKIKELPGLINSEYRTEIHLNTENIASFLAQFGVKYEG